jgi:hypothetical protein
MILTGSTTVGVDEVLGGNRRNPNQRSHEPGHTARPGVFDDTCAPREEAETR